MEQSSTDSANYLNYTVSGTVDLPASAVNDSSSYTRDELNLPYAFCEVVVAVCAVIGNALVIIVFSKDRKLRRRTNYYIISLATADLLVGLFAIPFAILASIGLPTNLYACLFTVSVLVVLCTISIFCLVAVSIDRYWAILHPMGYSRNVRTKTAVGIICVCWMAGTLVGFLPLFGWNAGKKSDEKCIFVEVMDYDYLVFLYFATIIFPALLIAAFYAHIYRVVVKQLRQIVEMNPGRSRGGNQTTGTMLRLLGAAQKRDVKATQNLSRIVAFFIICWFPLYTINCVKAFCPDCEVNDVILNSCIILSHLNSVGNPLLYAYHLKDFRAALQSFICRLLFPNAAPATAKNRQLSVISENRGSVYGSQRSKLRQNVAANPGGGKTPRTNLLRRATDNAASLTAAGAPGAQTSRTSSPEVELRSKSTSKSSDKNEDDILVSQNPSPESSEVARCNDFTSLNVSPISERSSKLNLSDIEMKTCKSFVDFIPDPTDDEGGHDNAVCVVEADVNDLPHLELTLSCRSLQLDGEETRKEMEEDRNH
ncbi:adenosine receptor A2b-like [Venturia canescens]|uniref:adenosine receptor A2b-like n=1 Tax=Venturia canescens TaxID=32260 RepID=UPI001C9C1AE7|nr:adenosine receptor A2b-like [Venturia canescens]